MPVPVTPTRKLAVIVNPTAGRGAAGRALPRVQTLLGRKFSGTVTIHITTCRGHAERLATEALEAGVDIVAPMGGDGTLHEVANALLNCRNRPDASLALIPFGTGNDFARAVGLRGTLDLATDAAAHGERRFIDVGTITSPSLLKPRRFLVAAGIGFVADTAQTVNTRVKHLSGPAAYVYGAIATLRSFQPLKARVSYDGGEATKAELSLVSVSNVATTGGGIKIAPDAQPDDGVFDVCVVEALPKLQLISKLPLAFSGRHVLDRKVRIVRCAALEIETEKPCSLWIDGEVTGSTPAGFRIAPAALPMLLPPRAGYQPTN